MFRNKSIAGSLFTLIISILLVIPDEALSAEFQISYPESNSIVRSEVIVVEGTGAIQGATIEISVLTNEWYIQDGKAMVNSNGTWSYGPCHLSGKGSFNNHSIKARMIRNDGATVTKTVRGVVRE